MENNQAYFSGGGIVVNDLLYVERPADRLILDYAKNSTDLICIFETHQSGKTSLYHRMVGSVRPADNLELAFVNLYAMGTYNVSEIKWYFGVAYQIYQKLGLPVEELKGLHSEFHEHPGEFWRKFIESLSRLGKKVAIFFDDFNVVDLFDFNFDNFFAPLAAADDRILFVLMGVIPSYMIEEKSPCFTKLKKTFLPLRDFDEHEMKDFSRALRTFQDSDKEKIIADIYRWTSGHPYFSQKIGENLAPRTAVGQVTVVPDVNAVVSNLFFNGGISTDVNLAVCNTVFNRLFPEDDPERLETALTIYELLLNEPGPLAKTELRKKVFGVAGERFDQILEDLRCTSLVAIEADSAVKCRNQIYRETFNGDWVSSKRPAVAGKRQNSEESAQFL